LEGPEGGDTDAGDGETGEGDIKMQKNQELTGSGVKKKGNDRAAKNLESRRAVTKRIEQPKLVGATEEKLTRGKEER